MRHFFAVRAGTRFLLGIAVGAAALIAVGVAAAAISASAPDPSVPQDSSHYQRLSPWACLGNGGAYSLSDSRPVLLKYGWVAQTADQVRSFFQYSTGSVTITNGAGETIVDGWQGNAAGDPPTNSSAVAWSPIAATPIPNNGTSVSGYGSFYAAVLTFTQPGTYTVTTSITMAKTVNDGFGAFTKGTHTTGPCTITVTS